MLANSLLLSFLAVQVKGKLIKVRLYLDNVR